MRYVIKKRTLQGFVLFFIIMFPAFQWLGFDMKFLGSGTPSYIRYMSLLSFALSVCLYAFGKVYKKKDMPIIFYTMAVFCISMFFYLNKGGVAFSAMISFVSVFYAVLYFARKYGVLLVDYIFVFFTIYWFVDFIAKITPISYKFIGSNYTFLGHKQIYSMLWALYIAVCLLRNYLRERRMSISQMGLLLLATVVTAWNGVVVTGLAMVAMIGLLIFYKDKKNRTSKILLLTFIIVSVLNYAIVFMSYQETFIGFLTMLGEDASLNGRTYIWSLFIPEIYKSPLIGVGYKTLGIDLSLWGEGRMGMDYCHNTILQELANGGLVQMILFVILNISTIKAAKKINNNKIRCLFFSTLVSFYLIMISESITYFCYFNLLVALISVIGEVEGTLEKTERKMV